MFPATHLQPGEVAYFVCYFVERILLEDTSIQPGLIHILEDLPRLGLHTRILRISPSSTPEGKTTSRAVRYVWTHATRRPWGVEAPIYCTRCKSVKSFVAYPVPADGVVNVIFKCKGLVKDAACDEGTRTPCTREITVILHPSEACLDQGPSGERGSWQQHLFTWNEDLMARF